MKYRASLTWISIGVLTLAAGCAGGHRAISSNPAAHVAPRNTQLTRDLAATRAKQVAHVSYILWFGLDEEHNDYQGRTVINFQLRDKAREVSSELLLDFAGGDIRSLSVNGVFFTPEALQAAYDGTKVHLKTKDLQMGSNRIELAFAHPYANRGSGIRRFVDPVDNRVYLFSRFEPYGAHLAFPCFDQPDLKAPFEVAVETPEDWAVVSNTTERDTSKVDGRRSWAFPPSPVLSPYLFALHAGPFWAWKSEADGVPLRLLARHSVVGAIDAREWFKVTQAGLEFFGSEFGYPYPYQKYDQVLIPDWSFETWESAGAVAVSERFIHRTRVSGLKQRERSAAILHLLAHMWFGDLVTQRWWNGLWLNEGFATYLSALAMEKALNQPDAWLDFYSTAKLRGYQLDFAAIGRAVDSPVHDTLQAAANYDGISNGKGASAVQQLAFSLGEDDFREGVQRYIHKFAYRNAAIADFMHALTEASGKNLGDWQKSWLQTPGVNSIQAEWTCQSDDKSSTLSRLVLKQTAGVESKELRRHHVRIAFYSKGKNSNKNLKARDLIEIDVSGPQTTVESAVGKPCPDLVFTNAGDQDYSRIVLDDKSLKFVEESLSQIEEPGTRQQLWQLFWQQVRDGVRPAQSYIELAQRHLPNEHNARIVDDVLLTLYRESANSPSAVKYASADLQADLRNRIEQLAVRELKAAAAGSDLQYVYYDTVRRIASRPQTLQLVAGLLDGTVKLPGLRITRESDQERRWELIQALARGGDPSAAERIKKEAETDATLQGKLEAVAAEARLSSREPKQTWLRRIANVDSAYTPGMLLSAASGLYILGQEELLASSDELFFDTLSKMGSTESDGYAAEFVSRLFPSRCTEANVEKLNRLIASGDAGPKLLRSLRLARSEEERCMRARERSRAAVTPGAPH